MTSLIKFFFDQHEELSLSCGHLLCRENNMSILLISPTWNNTVVATNLIYKPLKHIINKEEDRYMINLRLKENSLIGRPLSRAVEIVDRYDYVVLNCCDLISDKIKNIIKEKINA